MRAVVRNLLLDPNPRELSSDPSEFLLLPRLFVGPSDGQGEESSDVEVCTPDWLALRCAADGFVDGRHTVITTLDTFTEDGLRSFLTRRVENTSGETWPEVAEKVAPPHRLVDANGDAWTLSVAAMQLAELREQVGTVLS